MEQGFKEIRNFGKFLAGSYYPLKARPEKPFGKCLAKSLPAKGLKGA
jgi:hypothetical protein